MSGTVNLTKHFTKQGPNKNTSHEAIVVDNNDPDELCRITCRIQELHQGIEDKYLPWCIPKFGHADGAKGGDHFDRSGTMYIPKKGTKVLVEFQDGDPHYPVWSGYTVDDTTKLKEISENYPDRAIVRFSTGAFMLIDTKTNEVFFHNPGDTYKIVQGDVEQDVYGDMQFVVGGSQGKSVDSYFTGNDAFPVKAAKQSQTKNVDWKGLGESGSGNFHVEVTGDYTMHVGGNRIVHIDGDDTLVVGGKQDITVGESYSLQVGSTGTMEFGATLTVNASSIFLN